MYEDKVMILARAVWLTLATLGQNSPGVSHICYNQTLPHQNCSDSCAAIISVGTCVGLKVPLIGVHKCLNCGSQSVYAMSVEEQTLS